MTSTVLTPAFASKPAGNTTAEPEKPIIPIDISMCQGRNKGRAAHIINTVAQNSELGKELLEGIARNGYRIMMFGADGWGGCVSAETKMLSLNCMCSDEELMQVISHEARHIQQFENGIESDCNRYDFRGAVMSHRAKEADAQATSCAVCYDLMRKGIDGPMKAFEKDDPLIVKGFMDACKDPKGPVTDKMLQGAFEGWYKNEEMVVRYENGYLRDGGLNYCWEERNHPETFYVKPVSSKEIVETICRNASGKCYWADNPKVLEQPEKQAVSESTRKKCQQTFAIRKNMYNLEEDKTYQTLPLREELKAQKKKPANTNAAIPANVAAQLIAARRGR
ncbi:MAG: hypothetical protein IJ752_03205 [Alphaproteobacteria bacterium]|nr:hypothetical protein [Alphaproteobacteria bacterium]